MNLKTTFLTLTSLLFSFSLAIGQEAEVPDYYYHQKGSHTFNLGVGFPTPANIGATFVTQLLPNGNAKAKATPQFTLKHEYALTDRLGIGVQGGYYTAETENINFDLGQVTNVIDELCCQLLGGDCCDEVTTTESGSSKFKIRSISVGARGAYHFMRLEKLDTYSVVSLSYSFLKTTSDNDNLFTQLVADAPSFEYFAGVGGRYYFNKNFAAYGEFGSGALTPFHVNLGLTYRP